MLVLVAFLIDKIFNTKIKEGKIYLAHCVQRFHSTVVWFQGRVAWHRGIVHGGQKTEGRRHRAKSDTKQATTTAAPSVPYHFIQITHPSGKQHSYP